MFFYFSRICLVNDHQFLSQRRVVSVSDIGMVLMPSYITQIVKSLNGGQKEEVILRVRLGKKFLLPVQPDKLSLIGTSGCILAPLYIEVVNKLLFT